MDAEFLARAGAAVTTSDLSLGAATRAKTRSERHRLGFRSIVADVERLPYADKSVDLVSVHDGLHHLDDPYVGLSEMARVARRWVVVTEPARASITRLAVCVGLALETEEAGNRVARMEPLEVAAYLEARGFKVLLAERYGMYYQHRPGRAFRLLSSAYVFPLARAGWRFANALLGQIRQQDGRCRRADRVTKVDVSLPSRAGRDLATTVSRSHWAWLSPLRAGPRCTPLDWRPIRGGSPAPALPASSPPSPCRSKGTALCGLLHRNQSRQRTARS